MLAALILGLKRQSGRWPETFHWRDYGTFSAGARFFLFNLEFRHKREASALLARVDEVIE
jgi:hypothetical protein